MEMQVKTTNEISPPMCQNDYHPKDKKKKKNYRCWRVYIENRIIFYYWWHSSHYGTTVHFNIKDWNAKVRRQKILGVTGKFGLGYKMKQGKV